MKKFFALLLATIMVCTLLAGCNVNVNMDDVNVSANINVSGGSTDTSSSTDSKTSSSTSSDSFGTGGVFLAPEVKNLPAVWTKARPTITWTSLKGGATARVIVETADGKAFIDKGGITGTSYTLEKDLTSGKTYVLKVLYQRNGEEAPMTGITKKGKEIFCNIKTTTSNTTGGNKETVTMEQIVNKIKNSSDYQIMMIGDSITYGTGSRDDYPKTGNSSPDDEKTYVAVFAKLLGQKLSNKTILRYDGVYDGNRKNENGTSYIHTYNGPVTVQSGSAGKITVVRSGIGGNTVARLLKRKSDFLGKAVANKAADLFIIKSGINDALYHVDSEGQKRVEPDVYKENLNTLLTEIAKSNPNADVILMTPTVNDDHTKKTSSQLDIYATKMKEVAAEWGVPVIDLHKLWMDHLDKNAANYGSGDWLTTKPGDLCHPSPKGHEAIAKEMIRALFG